MYWKTVLGVVFILLSIPFGVVEPIFGGLILILLDLQGVG